MIVPAATDDVAVLCLQDFVQMARIDDFDAGAAFARVANLVQRVPNCDATGKMRGKVTLLRDSLDQSDDSALWRLVEDFHHLVSIAHGKDALAQLDGALKEWSDALQPERGPGL